MNSGGVSISYTVRSARFRGTARAGARRWAGRLRRRLARVSGARRVERKSGDECACVHTNDYVTGSCRGGVWSYVTGEERVLETG